VVRRALVTSSLLLALAAAACVDDSIPLLPDAGGSDGGAGDGGSADRGASDGGPTDGSADRGASDGGPTDGSADAGASDGGVGDDGGAGAGASDGGPVLLASAESCGDIKLVVVGDVLFWTESGTGMVKSVPTSGGRATVIAANQMGVGAIAVDDTFVYWVYGQTMIRRRPLVGGNESVFVDPPPLPNVSGTNYENHINALLVAGRTLFYGRFTYVYRIPTDGTTPQLIASSPMEDMGVPGAFALDATHLYQVEIGHNAVSREVIDGTQIGLLETGAMEPLAPDRIAVSRASLVTDAVAVKDGRVVWANGIDIESQLVDTLASQGAPGILANSAGFNPITGFVISGSVVYFGEEEMDTVEMAPVVTGSDSVSVPIGQVIALDQKNPGQFAADDKNIYWRTTDCRIMKLAKP
jgi:hypothetical protein